MSHPIRLTFPSDESSFPLFYRQVAEVIEELLLPEDERFRFLLCVSEAFTNAFVHGNKKDPNKKIDIVFTLEGNLLRVEVDDEGEGRIVDVGIRYRSADIETSAISGRGIGIIKKYADSINVSEREEGGIRFTMFWKLKNKAKSNSKVIETTRSGG